MESFILDRRLITGSLNEDTPICVIIDLAHGNRWRNPEKYPHYMLLQNLYESNECLNRIENWSNDTILKATKEDLKNYGGKIAAFINADKTLNWNLDILLVAFKHMLSFSIQTIPITFSYGPKTPSTPYSYNACMLYRICKHYNISMKPTTTINELYKHVLNLGKYQNGKIYIPKKIQESFHDKKILISSYINFISNSTNLPFYIEEYDLQTNSFDKLRPIYDKFSKNSYLMTRISFESHEEAIIVAALNYGIDITQSRYPILELENLYSYNKKSSKEDFTPIDPIFAKLYERNPDWFFLKKNYSPSLSMVYNDKTLKEFLNKEGYTQEQIDDFLHPVNIDPTNKITERDLIKNALFESRINDTFYLGWHPNALNDRSLIELEDFEPDKIDSLYCVTYGSLECENNLTTYLISELIEHFTQCMSFSNPIKIEQTFSTIATRKLQLICYEMMGYKVEDVIKPTSSSIPSERGNGLVDMVTTLLFPNNPATQLLATLTGHDTSTKTQIRINNVNEIKTKKTDPKAEIFEKLLKIIQTIEKKMISLNPKGNELKQMYNSSNEEDKKDIFNFLSKLMDAGMYMRGWKVSSGIPQKPQLPIRSVDTVIPPRLQDEVSKNTLECIAELETLMGNLKQNYATLLKSLPLVIYQTSSDGKLSFKESTDSDEGFTIWQRINIVKKGDFDYTNSCSCIRLSSNWICSSAYYYLVVGLGYPALFDITELAKIS